MLIEIYADTRRRGFCRSCRAAVEWAEIVKTGRAMPFEGEIVVSRTQGSLLEGDRIVEVVDTTVSPSHVATCPEAREWRHR